MNLYNLVKFIFINFNILCFSNTKYNYKYVMTKISYFVIYHTTNQILKAGTGVFR